MSEKKCSKCWLLKDLNKFHCSKRYLDGRIAVCKECMSKYSKERYSKNIETYKTYNDSRSQSRKEYDIWWRSLSAEEKNNLKIERRAEIDQIVLLKRLVIESEKIVRAEKKQKAKQMRAEKTAERLVQSPIIKQLRKKERTELYITNFHNDPLFRIKELLRQRAIKVFKRNNWKRDQRSAALLGADFEIVKVHIEQQFKPGMSWLNHGEWHIDHIRPLDLAKTIEDVYPLFHYTNLQPLWAGENISKSNKLVNSHLVCQ